MSFDEITDSARMARLLEAQEPHTDPRAAFCYHAMTFGWLCGELVRRVDGRSIGRFFAEEVASPLGLEVWIGLPRALEGRVSRIELASGWPATGPFDERTFSHDPLLRAIWGNPPTFAREMFAWNDPAFHAAEIPGVGGIGDRSRRRAPVRQPRPLARSTETLALATTTLAEGWDDAHGTQRRFGVGFELQTDERGLGPPEDAFGHSGAGARSTARGPHAAWASPTP